MEPPTAAKRSVDRVDLLAGLLVFAVGAFVVWESGNYGMGRMANIGPGFFPRALGIILILAGLGTMVSALGRGGALPPLGLRAGAAVGLSLLAFALLVEPFGLVPATIALTFVARFAEPHPPLLRVAALSLALSALCTAVFVWGLGLPINIVTLP